MNTIVEMSGAHGWLWVDSCGCHTVIDNRVITWIIFSLH